GRVGPDVVIEATGLPSLVELAVTTVRRGGRVVLAGISGGAASLPITQIVPFERTVIGSLGYNYDIPRVLDLIAEKRFDPGALHTGTYPLSEGLAAFAELDADRGAHLKILLTPKEL
ncbi:zinc-binding dehydrogenase, partial [Amycolatopsis mediterranei]